MLPKGFVCRGLALGALFFTFAGGAFAASASSAVGSENVAVADPNVPLPAGAPCTVDLFDGDTFNNYSTRPFSYAPPAGCPGPWSKVVLDADFGVTAGIQYDRTASIWLGGVNLYFGTTQEPDPTVAQNWRVERDVTDYSALLSQPGQGQAVVYNIVNSTYTGVIHGDARLLFYRPTKAEPAAAVPDAIYPLGSDPLGNTVALNTSTDQLAKTLSLPANVVRAYLDVFAQSQNDDEFWYTCVPDQYAAETQECGGGNFREVEISIDGQPAGAAPVYPWIFTGGIDFFLWEPTPDVRTLNFLPYRVDLTPFAGLLSNGVPHTVAINVAGANNYFSTTASLLVYLDPSASQVSGQIELNTLQSQPATPAISSTLSMDASGDVTGGVTTTLNRHFLIEGYVNTSQGHVVTLVESTVGFSNTEAFTINASTYAQQSIQLSSAENYSKSSIGSRLTTEYREQLRYPFNVNFIERVAADGSEKIPTTTHQSFEKTEEHAVGGVTQYSASVSNTVDSTDTLNFDASGNFTGHNGASEQTYVFDDSLGGCYQGSVGSRDNVVTSYSSGAGCPRNVNHLLWYSHPDGSPDNGDVIPNP